MHSRHAAGRSGERGPHHADAGVKQKLASTSYDVGGHPSVGERLTGLTSENGRPLNTRCPVEHDDVAWACAPGGDQPLAWRFAEHASYQDRPFDGRGHLGVPADCSNLQLFAGLGQLVEDGGDFVFRAVLRQHQRAHEPARLGPHHGHVVGVDLHCVPSDEIGGKRDRVGGRHQQAVTQIQDRCVLPHPWAYHHAPIPRRQATQHLRE